MSSKTVLPEAGTCSQISRGNSSGSYNLSRAVARYLSLDATARNIYFSDIEKAECLEGKFSDFVYIAKKAGNPKERELAKNEAIRICPDWINADVFAEGARRYAAEVYPFEEDFDQVLRAIEMIPEFNKIEKELETDPPKDDLRGWLTNLYLMLRDGVLLYDGSNLVYEEENKDISPEENTCFKNIINQSRRLYVKIYPLLREVAYKQISPGEEKYYEVLWGEEFLKDEEI